jgi:hypothetical protein
MAITKDTKAGTPIACWTMTMMQAEALRLDEANSTGHWTSCCGESGARTRHRPAGEITSHNRIGAVVGWSFATSENACPPLQINLMARMDRRSWLWFDSNSLA